MTQRFALFKRCFSSIPLKKDIESRKKVTIHTINKMMQNKEPITCLTAHDYVSGMICEKANVDLCLIGDSLAMVCLGLDNTNQVTLDDMIHHSRAVARGCKNSFLIGDMPFGSYETSPEQALDNAIKYIKKSGVESVKMEGGRELIPQIEKLAKWGIPVVGHIGLTPQRSTILGGFRVQGKTFDQAVDLHETALELEKAGCMMIVLEAMPEVVAKHITESVSVPTIGIGAGNACSGQVLVQMDALGMFDRFLPRFCKVYRNLGRESIEGIKEYCQDVKTRSFPDSKLHTYAMASEKEEKNFLEWISSK